MMRGCSPSSFVTKNIGAYHEWIERFDTLCEQDYTLMRAELQRLNTRPKFMIVPLVIAADQGFRGVVSFNEALRAQHYENWSCAPILTKGKVRPADLLSAAVASDADYIVPLPVDARLARSALCEFVFAIAGRPDAALLYGDEDILIAGKRAAPCFKTDYDSYAMLGRNLVGSPVCFLRTVLRDAQLGTLKAETVDNLMHELVLRVEAQVGAERIVHIPTILCHRSATTDWDPSVARQVVSEHLKTHNRDFDQVTPAPLAPQWNRISWKLPQSAPLVSIIIPTRDKPDLLKVCTDAILNRTDYPRFELLIVDNGTRDNAALSILSKISDDPRVRVIRDDSPFNYSALNNKAAKCAKGDILLLLNNDIDVLDPGWLREMVSLVVQPGVGIVGAKLLYPNGLVQHAGVVFGPDQVIIHQMRLAERNDPGPTGELALVRAVSAVTAACLAIHRNLFDMVGGLNEENFKVAYNDIDLCRNVSNRGFKILWTPFAELLHFESISRGLSSITHETLAREQLELADFWRFHPEDYERPDPFHNPNIVYDWLQTRFASPPRRLRPWHESTSFYDEASRFFY